MSAMSATAACRGLASSASGLSSARVIASDVAAIQQANRGVGGATIHFVSRSSSAITSSVSAITSRSSSSSSSSFFHARFEQAEEEGNHHRQSCLELNSAVSRRWLFSLFPQRQAAFVASVASRAVGTSSHRGGRSLPSVVVPKAHTQGEGGEKEVVEGGGEEGPHAEENLQGRVITGKCFVVDDNIDTDQIIPAERLTLVPSKPDEYEKLGSYAMEGLPARYGAFIEEGEMKTKYAIMIGGKNFGCGSSREHAPVALGAAGCKAVVAQSFARIFFRNCVATGELYPVETDDRVCDECATGNEVTVDMVNDVLVNHTTGKQYRLTPIGEAGPVIDAGGIFSYARQTGMIAQPSPA